MENDGLFGKKLTTQRNKILVLEYVVSYPCRCALKHSFFWHTLVKKKFGTPFKDTIKFCLFGKCSLCKLQSLDTILLKVMHLCFVKKIFIKEARQDNWINNSTRKFKVESRKLVIWWVTLPLFYSGQLVVNALSVTRVSCVPIMPMPAFIYNLRPWKQAQH